MQIGEGKLERQIRAFQDGSAPLEDVRDMAADIGKQGLFSAVPLLLTMLKHEDEIVRYWAIISLGFKLKIKDATDVLVNVLDNDPDADCRDAAVGALKDMWRNSRDRQIIERLGSAALNDPDEDVRKAAYSALITVNGISDEEFLAMLRRDRPAVDPDRIAAILAEHPE